MGRRRARAAERPAQAPEAAFTVDVVARPTPTQLHQLAVIERRSFPKHESLAASLSREISRPSCALFIASSPQEVLGFLLCSRNSVVGRVEKLVVAERHRRRGIGRALMEAALEALAARVPEVLLHVDPQRAPAVALYRSLGFEEGATREDFYKEGRAAVEMSRSSGQ